MLTKVTSAIQTLVAFLLAGFVAKVVSEWREQRLTYTTLLRYTFVNFVVDGPALIMFLRIYVAGREIL